MKEGGVEYEETKKEGEEEEEDGGRRGHREEEDSKVEEIEVRWMDCERKKKKE